MSFIQPVVSFDFDRCHFNIDRYHFDLDSCHFDFDSYHFDIDVCYFDTAHVIAKPEYILYQIYGRGSTVMDTADFYYNE